MCCLSSSSLCDSKDDESEEINRRSSGDEKEFRVKQIFASGFREADSGIFQTAMF